MVIEPRTRYCHRVEAICFPIRPVPFMRHVNWTCTYTYEGTNGILDQKMKTSLFAGSRREHGLGRYMQGREGRAR